MTPTPEKAAPIPALRPCPFCGGHADELMLFCDPDEGWDNSGPSRRIQCAGCNVEAPFYPTKAEAVEAWNRRADRETRPSLPDSREERIREDERDRLLERARKEYGIKAMWLVEEGAMLPADRARARQGGNNG